LSALNCAEDIASTTAIQTIGGAQVASRLTLS